MKPFIIILISGLVLSACGSGGTSNTSNTGSNDSVIQKQDKTESIAKEGDKVSVDYVGKLEDGTIFDASIESEAKKSTNYSAGRSYEPLPLTLEEGGGTITGFWKGIVGMKIGETKKVTIAPKDGYGEAWTDNGESTVEKKIFDDTLVRTIKKSETLDVIKMEVAREVLEKEGSLPKVGDVLTNERGVKATVDAIDEKNVSLSIDNANNPFSGKKLVKGTTITFEDGNTGTITAVGKDDITLSIKNTANPFAGKKLEVGLEGMYQETQKVKITKIEGDTVTISIQSKNANKLAGQTLVFDITLKDIK